MHSKMQCKVMQSNENQCKLNAKTVVMSAAWIGLLYRYACCTDKLSEWVSKGILCEQVTSGTMCASLLTSSCSETTELHVKFT